MFASGGVCHTQRSPFSTVAPSSHSHDAGHNVALQLSRLRGRAVRLASRDSMSLGRFRFGAAERTSSYLKRSPLIRRSRLTFLASNQTPQGD
jgi:hypothetical protein